MFIRNTLGSLILMFSFILSHAADYQCALDLDGDGHVASEGEIASCVDTLSGPQCPLDSVPCSEPEPTCPLDPQRGCIGGACSVGGTCNKMDIKFFNLFVCAEDGLIHGSQTSCEANCVKTAICTTSEPTCPLAGGTCRQQASGEYTCSVQSCVDVEQSPLEVTEIDSRVYKDDGARDESGMCLDQLMIYSGRTMECRTAGRSTAYRTCCKDFGEIMTDTTGSIQEMAIAGSAINATYQATQAAFAAYRAGQTASSSASAFTNAFEASFNPMTIGVSIAISLAIDYFVNNCAEMDMETGMLNSSGRCYETGEICKSYWPGSNSCAQWAKTYCCFNSKLGRIIHEGGRPQLQSFVGVPPTDCRGFYPEEFQYLDFSKIDMSDYYQDLPTLPQPDIENNMKIKTEQFINSMP